MQWSGYIQLVRPANVITAIADILAGIAIMGVLPHAFSDQNTFLNVILLVFSTSCLYGGGIVFNDVFDIEHDKIHRPERVIPSGRVSLKSASLYGAILFSLGILAAFGVSVLSGCI
ncbi:MAG: UbiA family prenyltransferase, partial [Allomuricauda sp.]